MKKHYYDHRTVLCKDCFFHRKAGLYRTKLGVVRFMEGCFRYGYRFHEYLEDADDCEGFMTEAEYREQSRQRELLKRKRKANGQ